MAEFSWAAAADVGLGLLGGATKALGAYGAHGLAKANAKAANIVREGQNDVRRSQTRLAATVRSINNTRIMEAAGKAHAGATTDALRTGDAISRAGFERSIQSAEARGRAATASAASGLGGAGIDAISQVAEMQLARRQEAAESRDEQVLGAATQRGDDIISSALMGLAQGPLTMGLDQRKNTVGSGPNVAGLLIAGLMDKKDSLQVMLGSLYDKAQTQATGGDPMNWISDGQDASQAAEFSWAEPSPVTQSTVPTVNIPGVSEYEDTDRFYNRKPPGYGNSIDALNTRGT